MMERQVDKWTETCTSKSPMLKQVQQKAGQNEKELDRSIPWNVQQKDCWETCLTHFSL